MIGGSRTVWIVEKRDRSEELSWTQMPVGLPDRGVLLVTGGLSNQQDHMFLNSFFPCLVLVEQGKDIEHKIPE